MPIAGRLVIVALSLLLLMVFAAPASALAAECNGLVATHEGTGGDDLIEGTPGNDVIVGLGGNDTIYGYGGDDVICGNAGDDWVNGGGDDDLMLGGSGVDTISLEDHYRLEVSLPNDEVGGAEFRGFENLIGSAFDDEIYGDSGDNRIEGGGGRDEIYGGAGNDTLIGGPQGDLLVGEDGDDLLLGQDHADTLVPGLGDDEARGGAGTDRVSYFDVDVAVVIDLRTKVATGAGTDTLRSVADATGGTGDDEIHGTHGANSLSGGDGDDLLVGYRGLDTLNGGSGHDRLEGRDGADTLRSGTGNDVVIGGGGGDYIQGEKGDDVLDGSAGPDRIFGGDGDDTLAGGTGGDDLNGDGGNDIVIPGPGSDTASAGPSIDTDLVTYFDAKKPVRVVSGTVLGSGQDELYGFSWVEGTEYDDTIERTGSVVFGLGGDDELIGWNNTTGVHIYVPGAGDDTVSGGGGYDYVSYVDATGGVNVRLDDGLATGYGSDSLTGVEGIEGSSFDDTLRGDDNPNGIYGLDGDDRLYGLSNDDYLDGGDGTDSLDGGSGADECVAGEAAVGCETIGAAPARSGWMTANRDSSPAMRALRAGTSFSQPAEPITRDDQMRLIR